jgi:putative Mg2+ transporter-C (MgtC) family protein
MIEFDSKDRIASNIVTGIGFVGAGVIFKSDTGVKGLTTAATVWMTAAIGMAIAAGMFLAAGVASLLVMIVLNILSYIGKWLERTNVTFIYKISFKDHFDGDKEYQAFMDQVGLRFVRPYLIKKGTELIFQYNIKGGEEKHGLLQQKLIQDARVVYFESVDPN